MKLYSLRDAETYLEKLEKQIEQLEKITISQQNEIDQLKVFIDSTFKAYRNPLGFSKSDLSIEELRESINKLFNQLIDFYHEEAKIEQVIYSITEIKLHEFEQDKLEKTIEKIKKQDHLIKSFFQYHPDLIKVINHYIEYCDYYVQYPVPQLRRKHHETFQIVRKYMKGYIKQLLSFKEQIEMINHDISQYLGT